MRNNQELLRALMKRHSLSYEDVRKLSGKTMHAVKAWLKPDTVKSHSGISDETLRKIYEACGEDLPKYKAEPAGVTLKDLRKGESK